MVAMKHLTQCIVREHLSSGLSIGRLACMHSSLEQRLEYKRGKYQDLHHMHAPADTASEEVCRASFLRATFQHLVALSTTQHCIARRQRIEGQFKVETEEAP